MFPIPYSLFSKNLLSYLKKKKTLHKKKKKLCDKNKPSLRIFSLFFHEGLLKNLNEVLTEQKDTTLKFFNGFLNECKKKKISQTFKLNITVHFYCTNEQFFVPFFLGWAQTFIKYDYSE